MATAALERTIRAQKPTIRLYESLGDVGDGRKLCRFSGCLEIDASIVTSSSTTTANDPSRSSTAGPYHSHRRSRSEFITRFHAFQLSFESPFSNPPFHDVNFTGVEHRQSSLVSFGQRQTVAGTFILICPFTIDVPQDLFPVDAQAWTYTVRAATWFKMASIRASEPARIFSSSPSYASFTIQNFSNNLRQHPRTLDSVMDDMDRMDLSRSVHRSDGDSAWF
ncbi:hypothetical protein BOTBODRAFT_191279 [Botryobasidium botryosum FD-172 SS1]|uniref:Uncharacterized protein n=1 Tax=Botryobasidium botryosum (strain FD-172 SS1) TaxID=930990 RepID=A0A067MB21_BOTB1|nr:hypothetical protein BOTBODRAFT_191279 [Botryobasidium botryosum FD-172 SS1]